MLNIKFAGSRFQACRTVFRACMVSPLLTLRRTALGLPSNFWAGRATTKLGFSPVTHLGDAETLILVGSHHISRCSCIRPSCMYVRCAVRCMTKTSPSSKSFRVSSTECYNHLLALNKRARKAERGKALGPILSILIDDPPHQFRRSREGWQS